jgi:hypothetical protein
VKRATRRWVRKICARAAGVGNICAKVGLVGFSLLEFFDWHIPCLLINGGRVRGHDVSLQAAENKFNRTST